MQLRQRFRLLLGFQFALALGLALLTAALFQNERILSLAQDVHLQSYRLADELRQSSDDLTRVARTFVVTGDADYERQYRAILAIRNGQAPRPVDYDRIYWDLVTKDTPKPRPDGPAVALHELMVREGFTAAELALLTSAQKSSDALVQTERIAMNAAQGLFDDGAGNFTVRGAPDRARAIALLHDEAYRDNKARIMRPIDDFFVRLLRRTTGEVARFEQRSVHLLGVMGGVIFVILGLFVYSFTSLQRQLLERERAEEAQRENEARIRILGDNLPGGMIYQLDMGPDGKDRRFSYLSAGVERLHEVPVGAVMQDAGVLYRQIVPEDLAAVATHEANALAAMTSFRVEMRSQLPSGRIRWSLVTSAPRRGANGRVYWDGIELDITERKLLELGQAELAAIVASSDDAILSKDLAGIITSWNQGAEKVFGYTAAEAVGRPMLMLFPPERAHEEREILTRIMRGEIVDHFETERVRKDGQRIAVSATISPLRDQQGRVVGASKIARDITERQRAREMLEKFNTELEQRVILRTAELAVRNREIEALLDSIPDTVLLLDEHGAVLSAHSPAGRAAPADSAHQRILQGDDVTILDIAREMQALARSTQQAVVRDFDRPLAGATISIEARATSAGGDRCLILLRDISARKRTERDIVENLERQKQLSEMKLQFITVASHEFRTPLAAAVGSAELLERHAERLTEAKRNELLARIQQALRRLTSIMDDMLMHSQADAGRMNVARREVDLARFVTDVLRGVEANDRQQHTFSFQQSGPPSVPADTNLLHRILSNLLENAVRYSPTGTTVSVALEVGAQAFALTITDEGMGVPAAEQERIFEPFVRGSNVGTIGGTGLGLNLARRYAELMGGRLELLPTVRGAAFRVSVPLQQPPT